MNGEKKIMRILTNKSKVSSVALILVLTIAATFITVLPAVNAAVNYVDSFIYVFVAPDPIGVTQQVLFVYWTADMPRPETDEEVAAGVRGGWYDVTLTVTKPGGTTQTIVHPKSDPVGGGYVQYTPDTVGTYYIQAHLPGQWRNTTTTQTYYRSATSTKVEFTVQQEPIEPWTETPLPTEYWTRPINAMNRDWWQVTGNWLAGAAQQWPLGAAGGTTVSFGYGPGPESAHIMWTKPYWAGGVMDYRTGVTGFATYHYQGISFSPPIILYGKVYYEYRDTAHTTQGYVCVDLYTGETIYYENETAPSFASIYNYDSPNQHGGFPYLWRTSGVTLPEGYTTAPGLSTWEMIDGFTGEPITIVTNVSAPRGSTAVYGKDGSITYYQISDGRLTVWNSSAILDMTGMSDSAIREYLETGLPTTSFWQWRPANRAVHNGSTGWSLNVSMPDVPGSILAVREHEFIIGGTTGTNNEDGVVPGVLWKISLERGKEGTLLWNNTFTPPSSAGSLRIVMPLISPEYSMFTFVCEQTLTRWGYSMDTMQQVWESEPERDLNFYSMKWATMGPAQFVYQGKLITCGYGGELIAYNITTGEVLWKYIAKGAGFECPYGNYPMGVGAIADGKIYIGTGEHSPTQPLYRGSVLQCIDASNGDLIWNFPVYGVFMVGGNSGSNFAIADGYLLALSAYDNQIYCFGKGPSATTVTASPAVITEGDSVLIKGMVTDQTPSPEANGKPAISDADQSAWMQYLYAQQPVPANAKGVEVTLDTIDPNGNFIHIGRVTSDISGMFSHMWTPEVTGKYTIIATFEGSKSYYASFAETAIGVSEAPEEPPAEEPEEAPAYTAIDLAIIAAVVVAIVIGIVNLWALRKRT